MNGTDNGAPETGAVTAPYDRLMAAARQAMIAAYPDKARALKAGRLGNIELTFAADALAEKGKCPLLHRLSDERIAQEIGDNPEAIFAGLSQSMIDFYRRKLDLQK